MFWDNWSSRKKFAFVFVEGFIAATALQAYQMLGDVPNFPPYTYWFYLLGLGVVAYLLAYRLGRPKPTLIEKSKQKPEAF